jgi:hypothetical protein
MGNPAFVVRPNGQAVVLTACADNVGSVNLYTAADLGSGQVTLPLAATTDTVLYTAATGRAVTVTATDLPGEVIAQDTLYANSDARCTVRPQRELEQILSALEPSWAHPRTGLIETMPRLFATSTAANTTASQSLRLAYFTAPVTKTVTTIGVLSGATAAGTPTLVKFALFSGVGTGTQTRIGVTAHDAALLAGTNTIYTKAMLASAQIVKGQRYAIGVLVAAGTYPSLGGALLTANLVEATPKMAQILASQADVPTSITETGLTAGGSPFYAFVS